MKELCFPEEEIFVIDLREWKEVYFLRLTLQFLGSDIYVDFER